MVKYVLLGLTGRVTEVCLEVMVLPCRVLRYDFFSIFPKKIENRNIAGLK